METSTNSAVHAAARAAAPKRLGNVLSAAAFTGDSRRNSDAESGNGTKQRIRHYIEHHIERPKAEKSNVMRTLMIVCLLSLGVRPAAASDLLVYEGARGPGAGRHIVFLAGDHEYRSEEALPALARILARHHGFRCTVLFTVDPETGDIDPGCNHMPGTDALQTADLMVVFLRFQNFPEEQMQPIVDYLDRAGPVVGLRTSTHAFRIPEDSRFARLDTNYPGDEFRNGFGRQILGETWVRHYGTNHEMSTRLDVVPEAAGHPVLRGVSHPWVRSGGYWVDPLPDSEILAMAQPLQGMTADAPPADGKAPCPGAWTRSYRSGSGRVGRVFTTTYGASVDLSDDDFRRMLVNACFWGCGLDDAITAELNVELVGPWHPTRFAFDGHRLHVRPQDLAGWDTPIMDPSKPLAGDR